MSKKRKTKDETPENPETKQPSVFDYEASITEKVEFPEKEVFDKDRVPIGGSVKINVNDIVDIKIQSGQLSDMLTIETDKGIYNFPGRFKSKIDMIIAKAPQFLEMGKQPMEKSAKFPNGYIWRVLD